MMKLHVGSWVEVRSKEEVLASLDQNGKLEGLPFTPQMFQYCGKRFKVYRRAHKTCDTVSGHPEGRRLTNAIHLEHRCDGKAYCGCQASCLIFWKEAWLKPVGSGASVHVPIVPVSGPGQDSGAFVDAHCTEEDVWKATREQTTAEGKGTRYFCQATETLNFTHPLKWWDARQYLEDVTSGNVSLATMIKGFAYVAFNTSTLAHRRTLGRPGRWLYDRFQALWGGIRFPIRPGKIASGQPTPVCTLNLQPGELVRVKSYDEILATVDSTGVNRGLLFDREMVPYCGRTYRVRASVTTFIDEKTGYIRTLKIPAVILEGVYCQSRFSDRRMFCPRSIYSWWREIWLERVTDAQS